MMTAQQLLVLNSLVTYAVENLSPTEEEQAVAELVERWATASVAKELAVKTHDYRRVNPTEYSGKPGQHYIDRCLEFWSEKGWRLVSVISDNRPGYADTFIFERPVGVSHPDD